MNLRPRLEQLKLRFEEVQESLNDPNATNDMDKFTALNKEFAELTPIIEAFDDLVAKQQEMADLEEMLAEPDLDAEMKEIANDDFHALKKVIPELEDTLQVKLLPKDEADDKNVIVEIRAGTGGDEAALFVADVFKMYCRFAELHKWKVEILESSANDIGGYKEIVAQITGQSVYARMKYESGTHRVQRVPATETQGRVHTSAITVAILPEAEEVDVNIDMNDLRIDTFRASGAGGQHVNTTDSAIRITHIPTGTVVSCQDEKSQHKNKAKALKIIYARVLEAERAAADKERADARRSQVGTGDRSERIRTYNYPQSRVTDHRINLTKHFLNEMMSAGEGLDEFIDALTAEDNAKRLSMMAEENSEA